MTTKIGYVGLTHLGLSYLASSLVKNYKVIGVDDDKKKIEKLKKNQAIYSEPKLNNILKKKVDNVNFTTNFKDLSKCKVVFFSQDVDTNVNNTSNFEEIKNKINKTIKYLDKKCAFVILSQVDVGFTKDINYNKKNLYYQVETLVFGNSVNCANKPERIIIGTNNNYFPDNKHYREYLKNFKCPIIHMGYESAELAKKAINIFLSSTITATNQISEICEHTNAVWSEISKAISLDKRIGRYAYLKPALGISGGNLERDIKNIENLNKKFKIKNKFIDAINYFSNNKKNWVFKIIKKLKLDKQKLNYGILGLTYKTNTNSLKNSTSISLIRQLCKKNKVHAYDPKANFFKAKNFKRYSNYKSVIVKSDILIIMTPWNEFKEIKINYIKKKVKKKIIIDPYSVIKHENQSNNFKFFNLGIKQS